MNAKTRVLGVVFAGVIVTSIASSCASSEEGVFNEQGNRPRDAGRPDTAAFGGASGSGPFGGTGGGSGSGFGGVAGTGVGGFSGTGVGGVAGGSFGGMAGVAGAGVGGVAGSGNTCNPSFCPSSGVGQPCCITPNGPCGTDNGGGMCQQSQDF